MTVVEEVRELVSAGKPVGLAIWQAAKDYRLSPKEVSRRYRRGTGQRVTPPFSRPAPADAWWNE